MQTTQTYQHIVEQRLREKDYTVELGKDASGIHLDVLCYKTTSPFAIFNAPHIFMLMRHKSEQNFLEISERLLEWSGTLPLCRNIGSLIKQRVSVSVFIAEKFSEEQKVLARTYECIHYAKPEFAVLVETATGQIVFNRSPAWSYKNRVLNAIQGRTVGATVLTGIIRTIDDVLKF